MAPTRGTTASTKRSHSPDGGNLAGVGETRPAPFTSLLRVVDQAVGNYDLPHANLPALAPNQGGPSGSSLQNLAPLLHHYGSGSGSPARTHYQPDENERGETQRWENGGSTEERADEGEGETEGETNGKSLKTTKRAAQNRAAQRAFRERKENYVRELERKSVMLDETMSRERTLASQLTTVQAELYALQTDRQDQMSSQSLFHRERAAWEKERIEWRLESEGQKREIEGLRGALKESRRMCDVAMMGAATAAAAAATATAAAETERR